MGKQNYPIDDNTKKEWSVGEMGKKIRSFIVLAVVIVAVLAVAGAVIRIKSYQDAEGKYEATIKELEEEVDRLSNPVVAYEEATRIVDISVVNAEIQSIGELATIEYLYTDAGKYEDAAELFGKEIPFSITTKSFIAKWDGSIKAGVDISKVTAEVDDAAKEIVVHIPKAEILSHEIDDDSIETLDERDGLFNKLKVEDIREFDAISKEAMEQRAIENGLLDKAYENAKKIIRRLIDTGLVEELDYTITFEEIGE